MTEMTLEVWKSDFLLPSVDYKCLQFMLCARICAAPIQIVPCYAPWNSPTGNYPVFRHGTTKTTTDFKTFKAHLQKQVPKCAVDGHLDAAELEEILAFESLLDQNLYPAYLHNLWVDDYNSSCVIMRWFGQQLVIPYGCYYVWKWKNRAKSYLADLFHASYSDSRIEMIIMKRALHCINLLSAKLGDKKYFFGNKPTSFDCLVFGYLAPLLRLPLPNDFLQMHIKGCQNLVRFVDSIINIYLPFSESDIIAQQESLESWNESKLKLQAEIRLKADKNQIEQEYPLRDKLLFGLTAVILSFVLALHLGLIEFEMSPVSQEQRKKEKEQAEAQERPQLPEPFAVLQKHNMDYYD